MYHFSGQLGCMSLGALIPSRAMHVWLAMRYRGTLVRYDMVVRFDDASQTNQQIHLGLTAGNHSTN
jgi:hypothetical protein